MNIAACGNPVTWPKCPIGRAKRGTGAIPCDASGHVRLGQKPTCAAQKGMSALHPKATVKADIRKTGKSAWRTPAATIITRLGSVYFSVRETLTA